ncbi:hypothetical protein FCH38_19575 [Agrobacterium tumefaciens]|nr:hypothetical protein [Agrobacterium sp. ICMP 6402]NTZ92867.1 hypothetical protein [Agrobacterium tumefaciens]
MLQLIENLTRRVVRFKVAAFLNDSISSNAQRFSDGMLISVGFVTVGLATSIPVLVIAVVCVSVGDALAKPTYLAALTPTFASGALGAWPGAPQGCRARRHGR